ncbi:alcohol dehydrogenase catalytic domain-containing protein [bacterium]|nr:alcohol dehydrogenase catalytic domain-containing protein [bacterium]
MKAVIFESLDNMVVKEDFPNPELPEDGLILKVESVAICGSDVRIFHRGHVNVKPPQIIGHEVAGIVYRVGRETTEFKEGERVVLGADVPCGKCFYCLRGHQNNCVRAIAFGYQLQGGFAQFMAVPRDAINAKIVQRLPEHLSFDEACLTEPLACVVNGQDLSKIQAGDTVVVIGAGPIGLMHVMLARAKGATKVIVSEISEKRLEIAKNFNIDVLIDAKREDPVEIVLRETDGLGADVVIVAAPSGDAQAQAIYMARNLGTVNFFGGLPPNTKEIPINTNRIHYKEVFVHGSHGSSPKDNAIALKLIASGQVQVGKLITHILPLDEINKGLNLVETGEALKVILKPWG